MKPKDIFLRSLRHQSVPRPAVGSATSVVTTDLQHKVGVFFPEAHHDPERMALLAQAGVTELGFDNVAPLFSVWHESESLGCSVDWGDPAHMPASHGALYAMGDNITVPADFLTRPGCAVPLKALSILRQRLGDDAAVVGKVFGPWTLGYHLFGVEEFLINTLLAPDAVRRAIDVLKEVTVLFGKAQIQAGADALCLADHATRDLCSPDAYRDFLLPVHRELAERLAVPLVLHICGDTSDRIRYIRETGISCFHFDSKVSAGVARREAGETLALMGGASNLELIRKGTPDAIARDVSEKLAARIDVLGPECAVPLDAPFANMKTLAEMVTALG